MSEPANSVSGPGPVVPLAAEQHTALGDKRDLPEDPRNSHPSNSHGRGLRVLTEPHFSCSRNGSPTSGGVFKLCLRNSGDPQVFITGHSTRSSDTAGKPS